VQRIPFFHSFHADRNAFQSPFLATFLRIATARHFGARDTLRMARADAYWPSRLGIEYFRACDLLFRLPSRL
jgi:hypothetical protein